MAAQYRTRTRKNPGEFQTSFSRNGKTFPLDDTATRKSKEETGIAAYDCILLVSDFF
jgi:hypothetical protein